MTVGWSMMVPAGCCGDRIFMANKLPPRIRHWGIVAIVVAGLGWLAFHPEILLEEPGVIEPSAKETFNRSTDSRKKKKPTTNNSADFDFYVLALSWSPSWCASSNRKSGLQCGGKRFYSFVVHGLWPQYEKGWPSNCNASAGRVPGELANSMLDIMPGYGLIQHEWKKHGTCSGLGQDGYFDKLRAAYDRIRFPARYRMNKGYISVTPTAVEQAFRAQNPKLPANAIAVTCGKRRLKEVRICFSKQLNFRPCPQVDGNACRKKKIIMPPVRKS